MKKRWWWVVGWVAVTVMVVVAFQGVAWDEALAALTAADPGWFALALVANLAILPLAAWQWIWFLPKGTEVGFGRMFWIHAVTSSVANGGPFLAGHAAGIHLLATRGDTGHATAVSVKALDQLAEGAAKLTLVGLSLLAVPLPERFRATALTLAVVVPVLAVVLLVAAHRGRRLERWARGSGGWRGAVLGFFAEAAVQLETMRRPWAFFVAVLLALAQKVVEGIAIFAVLTALGIAVPLWGILLSLTAVNLSTMASVTPANLGIYEASALVAYRLVGIPTDAALGLAVLQHVAYLVPMAGTGWVVLALSGLTPARVAGEGDGR